MPYCKFYQIYEIFFTTTTNYIRKKLKSHTSTLVKASGKFFGGSQFFGASGFLARVPFYFVFFAPGFQAVARDGAKGKRLGCCCLSGCFTLLFGIGTCNYIFCCVGYCQAWSFYIFNKGTEERD
jgi:hypothetical protein